MRKCWFVCRYTTFSGEDMVFGVSLLQTQKTCSRDTACRRNSVDHSNGQPNRAAQQSSSLHHKNDHHGFSNSGLSCRDGRIILVPIEGRSSETVSSSLSLGLTSLELGRVLCLPRWPSFLPQTSNRSKFCEHQFGLEYPSRPRTHVLDRIHSKAKETLA